MATHFNYFDLTTPQGWAKALENLTVYPIDSVWAARVEHELDRFPEETDSKLELLRTIVEQSMEQVGQAVFRKEQHKKSDQLAGIGALLVLRYATDQNLVEWGYQTAQKAHKYIPNWERKERREYAMRIARAIGKRDTPQLFKSWLTYCGMDMLEPYTDACLDGRKTIMETFASIQAKRYANKVLDVAIWEANSEAFETLLPHSKPKKDNSKILARSVKRAGVFRREIEELERSTNKSKDYIEHQKGKYNFIVQVIEKLIPLCDPVIVVRMNTSRKKDVEDMGRFLLPHLDGKHLDELAKYKSIVQIYPTIKSWETRKKLMQKVRKAEKPKPARPSM